MAGFLSFGGFPTFASTSTFMAIGANQLGGSSTTETEVQFTTHHAGVWSNLQVYIFSNTTSSMVIRFRKNVGDGNQLVSPGASTGYFEDVSNTDVVADGDELNLSYTAANTNASGGLPCASLFTGTTTHVTKVGSVFGAGNSFTAAATDNFFAYYTRVTGGGPEAANETYVEVPCTLTNLFVYVKSNARTTTTDFRCRKNGGDGNLVVQYTSGQTGIKEDTTHSDSLSVGDRSVFVVRTAAADTNAISVTGLWADLSSPTPALPYITGNPGGGGTYAANITRYQPIGGRTDTLRTTEAETQLKAEQSGTLSAASVYVSTNGVTATSTVRSRVSGGFGNLTLSIPSSTTGVFTDVAHKDTLAATTLINWRTDTGATGTSLVMCQICVAFTVPGNPWYAYANQQITMGAA